MNNVDIFKILYESNKRKNSTHITIAKPNLSFLQFLVNEFQHVRHQNNNNRDFDYPIMMATQYLIDRPCIMNLKYELEYSWSKLETLSFWFGKDTKHEFKYNNEGLSLYCNGRSVIYRDLCKKYKMGYDTFKNYFSESLFFELCKNFGDTI